MSSLRRGHANLLCIVPILADDLFRGSKCRVTRDIYRAHIAGFCFLWAPLAKCGRHCGLFGRGPRRAGPLSKYQVPGPWVGRGSEPGPVDRQHGRVVKALDSKSNGHCPRRFESGCCRTVYFFLNFFILVFFLFEGGGPNEPFFFSKGGIEDGPSTSAHSLQSAGRLLNVENRRSDNRITQGSVQIVLIFRLLLKITVDWPFHAISKFL